MFLIPQKISFNIFTLKHDLLTFVKTMLRVAFTLRMPGLGWWWWGGQPNLGNACILGAYGPALPPLTLSIKLIAL